MIDLVLGCRWPLAIDEGFIDPARVERLLGDLGDRELRKTVLVRCICSADFLNEVLIHDAGADIIIDLSTLETAFCIVSGFLQTNEAEKDSTRLSLLRMMTSLSLPFGDEVLTAGFLSEYISERARIEAAWEPDGFFMDRGQRDDEIAKDAIAAFIVGHEAGHFLYKTSPGFREEVLERVQHTVSTSLKTLGPDTLLPDGVKFLTGIMEAFGGDLTKGKQANDLEELVCDFAAGEAALRAMANALSDVRDVRTAFTAIQGAVAANWVIEAARDAFQHVVLGTPSGRAHRNELLAGRSLVTAINLSALRYKGIEGWTSPDDEAINAVLQDIPDVDEMLVKTFNDLWSSSAQLKREYLGAIYTNFTAISGAEIIRSAEAVLRQPAGHPIG